MENERKLNNGELKNPKSYLKATSRIQICRAEVGPPRMTDIITAQSFGANIYCFNVSPDAKTKTMAKGMQSKSLVPVIV